MSYSDLTLKRLFALSGNECAFPGCTAPVIDTEHGVLTGQICHIKARSPGGPRYDPDQTEEERNGYANLLVMCAAHNKIIDDPTTQDQFTVEMLLAFKSAHEERSRNSTVKEDVVDRIVELLGRAATAAALPAAPALVLRAEQRRYGMRVVLSLANEGGSSARAPYLSLRVPSSYHVWEYGIDGNGTPGFLGRPQGADTGRAPYFGGSTAQMIHPGVEVLVCILAFEGRDASSRPGGTLRIEYETAAEGQEKTSGVTEIVVGIEGG